MIFFFSSHSLATVTYYGTYAEITENEKDRFYLSNWKAFFETSQYLISYALIPIFIGLNINIRIVALCITPVGLSFLIALFMIKERSTLKKDVEKYRLENPEEFKVEEKIEKSSFLKSIKQTFKNKSFVAWLILLSLYLFGLQMFVSGQHVLASGPMGMDVWQISIVNTITFAPVPLMLFFYRKIMKRKGFRFAFQTALIAFAIAMLFYSFAYINWIPNTYARFALATIGGAIASYSIGAFFASPYVVPSQSAAEEFERTGKNNSSMYFAIQNLVMSTVIILSTGLLWPNLRDISLGDNGLFGAHLMPYIVMTSSLAAFFVAFILPKSYKDLGKEKKLDKQIKEERVK